MTPHTNLLRQQTNLGIFLLLFLLDDVLQELNFPSELLPLSLPLDCLLLHEPFVGSHLLLQTLHLQLELVRLHRGLVDDLLVCGRHILQERLQSLDSIEEIEVLLVRSLQMIQPAPLLPRLVLSNINLNKEG